MVDDVLARILADAEQRAGAPPSQVDSRAVTWRDGSLGCAQPGAIYTQALVPGYLVIVEAGGDRFEYHSGSRGHFILCPPDRIGAPLPGDGGTNPAA